ncbi:MAG: sugar phosphate isomerase/epimerase family protein [Methanocella sp.]
MRLGVNQWCFPEEYDLERCLRLASGCGFAGFEANVGEPEEPGRLTTETSEAEAASLRRRAGELGLTLHSLSTALHWTYPLTAADERVRERGVAIVERMLALAKAAGAGTVLVVPGLVTEEVSYQAAYGRALEALRHLARKAELAGVTIGVENVWNRFLLSPLEMRRFIAEVGSERVKAYLDVGNVLAFGYPEQWIEVLGELICQVHVKDFRLDVGNIHGFAPLGHGDVPWGRVREALGRVGYDGFLTVELPPRRFRPDAGVREAAETLKAIVEGELR